MSTMIEKVSAFRLTETIGKLKIQYIPKHTPDIKLCHSVSEK